MSAQLEFIFYLFVSIVVFPVTLINFILVDTNIIAVKPFVVTSGSMSPAVAKGSIIYAISKSSYDKGDIIAFRNGKDAISHRIVEKIIIGNQIYFKTKGDANMEVDEDLVSNQDVYGKVELSIPIAGNALLFIKDVTT